jgi:hypothetical protein
MIEFWRRRLVPLRWRRYLPLKNGVVQDEDEHEIVKETGEGSEYQN